MSTKKYVYKVTANNTSSGIYYDKIDEVFEYIKIIAKGVMSKPDDLHIFIDCVDARVVLWDASDYRIQSHYKYNMHDWIEAGMPSIVPVEPEDSEEELVQ